ncbi:MAG: HAD-IC family P-type ATPase, partial [Bacilli bacterium]
PIKKNEIIGELKKQGHNVMMIGDGTNDAAALSNSDIGVAMGNGTDVAFSSSDFIVMNSELANIEKIVNISRRINHNITFNLFWAFFYNIVAIPIAAGAFYYLNFTINPMISSLMMSLSSICVCLNALTLYIKKE